MFREVSVTNEETTSTLQAELLQSLTKDSPISLTSELPTSYALHPRHVEGTASLLPSPNYFDWFDTFESQKNQNDLLMGNHQMANLGGQQDMSGLGDLFGTMDIPVNPHQQFMAPSMPTTSLFANPFDSTQTTALLPHNLDVNGPDLTSLTDFQWERVGQ
jgi:hypothetical protein